MPTSAAPHVEEAVLSERGSRAIRPALSYLGDFFTAASDPFVAGQNEDGHVVMAVAENKLSFDLVLRRMAEGEAKRGLDASQGEESKGVDSSREWIGGYGNMKGHEDFRGALAKLMSNYSAADVDPGWVTALAGAGAVLDALLWCLCGEGDAVLIPAPYYPAFDNDLTVRGGLVPVHAARKAEDGFRVTVEGLEEAYQAHCYSDTLHRMGGVPPPKVVLLTNPDNPLGTVMTREELEAVVEWAATKDPPLHVVCDEIYACSVFRSSAQDHENVADEQGTGEEAKTSEVQSVANSGGRNGDVVVEGEGVDPAFESSALPMLSDERWAHMRDKVHVVWGLSKDWSASGFRVGVLVSRFAKLNQALDNLSYFAAVSNHTQEVLTEVLSDAEFTEAYARENRRRLRGQLELLERGLADLGVPCVRARAALFCFADFSAWLPEATPEAEANLQGRIFRECKLLVTPGAACHAPKPGHFRFCYAWHKDGPGAVAQVVKRLGEFLPRVAAENEKRAEVLKAAEA